MHLCRAIVLAFLCQPMLSLVDILAQASDHRVELESATREGRATLDKTGLHTGLCRSAVDCLPSLQEHELTG